MCASTRRTRSSGPSRSTLHASVKTVSVPSGGREPDATRRRATTSSDSVVVGDCADRGQRFEQAPPESRRPRGRRCRLASSRHAHSHSIVAGGLLLMSYTTRFTPFTWLMIGVETRASRSSGRSRPVGGHEVVGLHAPQGDRVLVGAAVAHHADRLHRQQHRERLGRLAIPARSCAARRGRSRRPCGAWRASPRVTSPRQRTARPGPGNGCRQTTSSGSPSSRPSRRTSSLNRSRSGSISSKPSSAGRPPTLWCSLIVAAGPSAAAAALDHVRVERPLGQELRVRDATWPRP